mmetsp:Transcript_23452/g.78868  ORF Transcript_23452/g.78868 Transcript_23452/m.78868 type:complete len:330 (+) Transcript_23452:122-1111(+)
MRCVPAQPHGPGGRGRYGFGNSHLARRGRVHLPGARKMRPRGRAGHQRDGRVRQACARLHPPRALLARLPPAQPGHDHGDRARALGRAGRKSRGATCEHPPGHSRGGRARGAQHRRSRGPGGRHQRLPPLLRQPAVHHGHRHGPHARSARLSRGRSFLQDGARRPGARGGRGRGDGPGGLGPPALPPPVPALPPAVRFRPPPLFPHSVFILRPSPRGRHRGRPRGLAPGRARGAQPLLGAPLRRPGGDAPHAPRPGVHPRRHRGPPQRPRRIGRDCRRERRAACGRRRGGGAALEGDLGDHRAPPPGPLSPRLHGRGGGRRPGLRRPAL